MPKVTNVNTAIKIKSNNKAEIVWAASGCFLAYKAINHFDSEPLENTEIFIKQLQGIIKLCKQINGDNQSI
jgi:hypothetical protein